MVYIKRSGEYKIERVQKVITTKRNVVSRQQHAKHPKEGNKGSSSSIVLTAGRLHENTTVVD